jgi:hypothetical protein
MFRRIFSRVFAVCLVVTALTLSGCNLFGPDNFGSELGDLKGTWASASDGYEISDTKLIYKDDYGYGFTGTIKAVSNFTTKAGVIIVEYTAPPTGSAEYPYSPAGNFQGVYYQELTATTVQLANAYDPTGTETATLEAAKAKFTLDKAGDYVTWTIVAVQEKK